jgi:hypothetical protein
MKRSMKWAAIGAGTLGILAVGFSAGRARAGGIPDKGALTYSGLLQDAKGVPLLGPEYVNVQFWDHPTKTTGVDLLCESGLSLTPLVNGRFSVPLPDDCTAKVASTPTVFVDVIVGPSTDEAASLGGRSKLGAVPYAVEAGNAARLDGRDAAAYQQRVAGTCAAGKSATAVNADGTVTCGAVVTAWTNFTPTMVTNAPNFPPITSGVENNSAKWRRVGESIEIVISTGFSGTSADTGALIWLLPNGLKPVPDLQASSIGGFAEAWNGTTATLCVAGAYPDAGGFAIDCQGASSLRHSDVGAVPKVKSVGVHFTMPIQGWTLTTP